MPKEKKTNEKVALKKRLHRKNITYRELADRIGLSLDAVNNKLNGYKIFNAVEIDKISQILSLKPDEIFEMFIDGGDNVNEYCRTYKR